MCVYVCVCVCVCVCVRKREREREREGEGERGRERVIQTHVCVSYAHDCFVGKAVLYMLVHDLGMEHA